MSIPVPIVKDSILKEVDLLIKRQWGKVNNSALRNSVYREVELILVKFHLYNFNVRCDDTNNHRMSDLVVEMYIKEKEDDHFVWIRRSITGNNDVIEELEDYNFWALFSSDDNLPGDYKKFEIYDKCSIEIVSYESDKFKDSVIESYEDARDVWRSLVFRGWEVGEV
jgi:hypothetical protein